MSKFGYLNQSNPVFIGANEAQEMVNCKIDRGYLEFGAFPVNTGLYDAAPARQVKLPNGERFVIDPSVRVPVEAGGTYASRGQVRIYDTPTNTKPVGIPVPTAGCLTSLSVHRTVVTTDYAIDIGQATTVAGQFDYPISLEDFFTTAPSTYLSQTHHFKFLVVGGLRPDQFTWRAGEEGTADEGKVIVTLFTHPGAGELITIRFHRYYIGNYKSVITQPGKYFYALTYYNPTTYRESPPLLLEVEITATDINAYSGECFLEFTDLLVEAVPLSLFPNLEIRIYRIPYGAEEYLFAVQKDPGAFSETFYDSIPDAELGAVLTTDGNTNLPLDSKDVMSIVLHKEKLFVAIAPDEQHQGFVYYSKTGLFSEFKAEFFFHFNANVIALTQFNECLAIFTKTDAYILYGDNEDNFQLSRVDFEGPTNTDAWKAGFSFNSAQAIAGTLIALAKSTNKKTDSILLFNSRFAVEASLPVKDILNTEGWTGNPALYSPLNASNRNRVQDNRFYVFELMVGDQAVLAKTLNVVYDAVMRGFCTYDSSYQDDDSTPLFKWRSKEFHVDGRYDGVQFNKRLYVRGKGKFTVELLGDGQLVTVYGFDLAAVATEFFTVKSTRYTTFSLRFVGEQGAQIHDWGTVADGHD